MKKATLACHLVTFTIFLRTLLWPNCSSLFKKTLLCPTIKGTIGGLERRGSKECSRSHKLALTRHSLLGKRRAIVRASRQGMHQLDSTRIASGPSDFCRDKLKDMRKFEQKGRKFSKQGVRLNRSESHKRFIRLSRLRKLCPTGSNQPMTEISRHTCNNQTFLKRSNRILTL